MRDNEIILVEILHEGMKAHAAGIPTEKQCKQCRGHVLIRSGHSLSPSIHIYKACPSCSGTGYKGGCFTKTPEQVGKRKLVTSEEASALFHKFSKKHE